MNGTPELSAAVLEGMADVVERLRKSTVQVRGVGRASGWGSGIVWRPGLVVTNAHVAAHGSIRVESLDGEIRDARLARLDRRGDLAALVTDTTRLMPVAITTSRGLRVGELVIAVGNPWGRPTGAVTTGIIHRVARPRRGPPLILADIRLRPGNSGGPLADLLGRVVGLNSMVIGGLAAAIPSEVVERFLQGAALAA